MKANKVVAIERKVKSSLGNRVFDIFNVLLMYAMMLLILVPLLHVLNAFFSDPSACMRHEGPLWHPLDFYLDAYKVMAKNKSILAGYMNTVFIVVVGTTINLVSTLVAACCLSRKNATWDGVLMLAIVLSMYFSGDMMPSYLVVKEVGLDGSIWSLIIPTTVNTYNLIAMRMAMTSVPESLEKSAKLGDANHWTILWKIMVPLMKPTIAMICLYYTVEHWNSWFNTMLFIRDEAGYPLRLVLRGVLLQNNTLAMTTGANDYLISETIQFATIMVATVLILAIYPFVQRYFVKSVMIGAMRG